MKFEIADIEEQLKIAMRERSAFLDERNQTRRELEGVRERMNALAVSNAKLSDNGRIESYLQTLQSLTQLAKDVGIPDAESTGHDTLVVQLREKYIALLAQVAANQEAADVLRLAKEIEDNHLIPDDKMAVQVQERRAMGVARQQNGQCD